MISLSSISSSCFVLLLILHFLCHPYAEQNNASEMKLMEVIHDSSTETAITAPTITATKVSIGISCSSASVKEGGLKPCSSGDHAEDEKMLLKKTDPRPRKMPISNHQVHAVIISSASETRTISGPALPVRNLESRSAQVSTRQLQQPIRKVPLNSSPLGRGDPPLSSRTNNSHSHMRSEVLMRSPSCRGKAASKSVFVQDRALTVSLIGSVPPDTEHFRSVVPVTASVFVSAGILEAPAQTRLKAVGEENMSSVRLEGDVAPAAKSTSSMDCQFLQFESDGEEDW
jgi:hypothetical protein